MIGKKSKVLIFLYLIFLVVLFLMCSTDLIIREPEKEVYRVAVIIEDVRDDNYGNFRKGMDQAAIEFNADVQFITLYERLNAKGQMELMEREQQDGVDALIVVPVEEQRVTDALRENQVTVPAVILGTGSAKEETTGMITIDYRAMGANLAGKIKRNTAKDCPVVLLEDTGGKSEAGGSFLAGAAEVFEQSGYSCKLEEPKGEEAYREMLKGLPEQGTVIVAGSPEALAETAAALEEDSSLSDRISGLYGRGNTLAILDDLDSGLITGLCVTDEFSRGYFSVCMAVGELEKAGTGKTMTMDSYYIEKKDLREPKYEKMLFPVE